MTFDKAKRLVTKSIKHMTLEEIQTHKVKLLDAWRESRAEYGIPEAVVNGFYIRVLCHQSNGYAPRDIFLTNYLFFNFLEAEQKEKQLLKECTL